MESLPFHVLFQVFLGLEVSCIFDTDSPFLFKEPFKNDNDRSGSLFGYALTMYRGKDGNEWIRIGAPKANDSHYMDTFQPGTVYECPIKRGCYQMEIPHPEAKVSYQERIWKNSFLGGTMDTSDTRFVMCGYRHYYNQYNETLNTREYAAIGTCFWSKINSNTLTVFTTLLNLNLTKGYSNSDVYHNYGLGEAGFSVHLTRNSETDEVILGAPGIRNWAGTPIRVRDIKKQLEGGHSEVKEFSKIEVPLATNGAANLFGYTVTSGHYFGGKELYYATSSPSSWLITNPRLLGTVRIFKFTQGNKKLETKKSLKGETEFEYFGGSLASGAINKDQYDDILVGAPFYKKKDYNEGRVYLFLWSAKENDFKKSILSGRSKGGQFGAAITYLGDINRDGFGDVAIGAPFENEGTGIVYIYFGTNNGLQQEPVQTLVGKDVFSHIRGFGMSISKPVDIDGNGYEDISIGAPLSGHAILFRSRPSVVIEYNFSSSPNVLNTNTENFTVNLDFSCVMDERDEGPVELSYSIEVEGIEGMNTERSRNITIEKNEVLEENLDVIVKGPLDHTLPVNVIVKYKLNYPSQGKNVYEISEAGIPNDTFCATCPLLYESKSKPMRNEFKIVISSGCGGKDNICYSNLTVNFSFPELRDNTFIMGSKKYVKILVTVENTGDNAYNTKLRLILPPDVSIETDRAKCSKIGNSMISCNVENPLRNRDEFELNLGINEDFWEDHMIVNAELTTTGQNVNKNKYSTTLKLKREADVTIYGSTVQEINYYGNSSIKRSNLTHKYTVDEFGDSPLGKLVVQIQVPVNYTFQDKTVTFLNILDTNAYFGVQDISCNTHDVPVTNNEQYTRRGRRRDIQDVSEKHEEGEVTMIVTDKTLFLNCSTSGVSCITISCSYGTHYNERASTVITLNMVVNLLSIAELAGSNDMVLISSQGTVMIETPKNFIQTGNRPDSVAISSIYNKALTVSEPLALWIIIVAVIIGLLLLIILILVLIKMGFFKREKKAELENLKAAAAQEDKIKKNMISDCGSLVEIQELDPPFQEEPMITSSRASLCNDTN